MLHREFTYQSADGLTLFCREFGPPRPELDVLCLPGLTRNSRDFGRLASRLSARYRVLTPDLRGRGRSQWDRNWINYHPGSYMADVLRLLEDLAIKRVVVIGTSLGGLLAMLLAATRGELIEGVVLNDVAPEVAPEALARIAQYVGRSAPLASWDEAVQQAKVNYGSAFPGLSDEAWREFVANGYQQLDSGEISADYDPTIGEAMRAAPTASPDLWPMYRALQAKPVLAIRGELSDLVTPAVFDRMLQEKPDLERVVVADRGHAPLLDEPECVSAIEQFLGNLAARRSQ